MKKNRKLNLDPDGLRVDSFATDDADGGQGTVRGHAATELCPAPSEYFTCKWTRTDYETCLVQCECTNRYVRCKGV